MTDEPMSKAYRLHAEGAKYTVTGGESKGWHGAPRTGRTVRVDDPAYARAQAWIEDFERSQAPNDAFEREVLDALSLSSYDLPLHRGRGLHPTSRPSFHCFGPRPPEAGLYRPERYNSERFGALYLASSVDGVQRELDGRVTPGTRLWVQQYKAPLGLTFLDARGLPSEGCLAQALFLLTERRDRHAKLAARLGELVAARCDGLIVPGVRAKSEDARYSNVVIFKCDDRWRDLVDQASAPQLLSEA